MYKSYEYHSLLLFLFFIVIFILLTEVSYGFIILIDSYL